MKGTFDGTHLVADLIGTACQVFMSRKQHRSKVIGKENYAREANRLINAGSSVKSRLEEKERI